MAVIKEAEKVPFSLTSNGHIIMALTDKITVSMDMTTGTIVYANALGNSLLKEQDNGNSFITKEDIGQATFSVKQTFSLDKHEFICGLGQLQKGKMSQRNQTVRLIQNNKETVIPFLLSNKGYGVYWDNYSPTAFSDSTDATSFDSEVGDCIDYYFMLGENADSVIALMRDLTGQAPMMPYWTYS